MKKLYFILTLLSFNVLNAQDIKIQEPEFAGEAFLINIDGEPQKLENTKIKNKVEKEGGLLKPKIKQIIEIEGCCSQTIAELSKGPLKILIKDESNKNDPTTKYQIVKLKVNKSKRELEVSQMNLNMLSVNPFSGKDKIDDNKANLITFFGKKFGESSYLLSCTIAEPGEYALITGSLKEVQLNSMTQQANSKIVTFSAK